MFSINFYKQTKFTENEFKKNNSSKIIKKILCISNNKEIEKLEKQMNKRDNYILSKNKITNNMINSTIKLDMNKNDYYPTLNEICENSFTLTEENICGRTDPKTELIDLYTNKKLHLIQRKFLSMSILEIKTKDLKKKCIL